MYLVYTHPPHPLSIFQVGHFSKYKLETDDSEDEEDDKEKDKNGKGGEPKRAKVCIL